MKARYFLASLTRIADFATQPFEVHRLPREHWDWGDYVAARIIGKPHTEYQVELTSGRMIAVMEGDHLIGAFGTRSATLGGCGDWTAIGADLKMEAMTSAGLFGKVTSAMLMQPDFMRLVYTGHVIRQGRKIRMRDFVDEVPKKTLGMPVVLLVGTSMACGKTTTGRVIIHELKQAGRTVVGAKFTGAGRYRDALTFGDAGADYIFDFVDVGLPSTVVPEEDFRNATRTLLNRIAHLDADVLVAEVGASPLEPYNGAAAIAALKDHICCAVLSASDPYSVVGAHEAFGMVPDLVTGTAISTDAGIALVKKLTGVQSLNIMNPDILPELRDFLKEKLPLGFFN